MEESELKGGRFLLSIDPGTYKIGLAVINVNTGDLAFKRIVTLGEFMDLVEVLASEFLPEVIVLGDGTGHKFLFEVLRKRFKGKYRVLLFPERNTTLRARQFYVSQGRNLIDTILRFFRVSFMEVDDIAAYLIGLDYLNSLSEKEKKDRKRRK